MLEVHFNSSSDYFKVSLASKNMKLDEMKKKQKKEGKIDVISSILIVTYQKNILSSIMQAKIYNK